MFFLVRGPCPGLNALANHNILPHNGKGIDKAMTVKVLKEAYNIDSHISTVFAIGAIATNPDKHADFYNLDFLDKHGAIEHDGSLSRQDAAFGNNHDFSQERFNEVIQGYEKAYHSEHPSSDKASKVTVDWKTASHVRYGRITQSKREHEEADKHFTYGLKEAITSYGESALIMNILGKNGITSLDWIKYFIGEFSPRQNLRADEG